MAKSKKRPLAVFQILKLRILSQFIQKVRDILADIGANTTLFATPAPTIASVNGHIDDLVDAETAVGQRVIGSVAARDEAYSVVLDDVYALMRYVQGLADSAANEQAAITVITSSGFDLKVNGVFVKPALAVKFTTVPGQVKLVAKAAAARAAYQWQQSTNNGLTWTDLTPTLAANTMVTGLTSKAAYQFRFRSITKDGLSAWSAGVGIVMQ
jgi:hypothetical protein